MIQNFFFFVATISVSGGSKTPLRSRLTSRRYILNKQKEIVIQWVLVGPLLRKIEDIFKIMLDNWCGVW